MHFLTMTEAAARAGRCLKTAEREAARGNLVVTVIAGRKLVTPEACERWIAGMR